MCDNNCSDDEEEDFFIVSSVLPQHLTNVQVNLKGLRVCLSGPQTAIDNRHKLDVRFAHLHECRRRVSSISELVTVADR